VSIFSMAPVLSATYSVGPTTTIARAPVSPVIVERMLPMRSVTTMELSVGLDTNTCAVAESTTICPNECVPSEMGASATAAARAGVATASAATMTKANSTEARARILARFAVTPHS